MPVGVILSIGIFIGVFIGVFVVSLYLIVSNAKARNEILIHKKASITVQKITNQALSLG